MLESIDHRGPDERGMHFEHETEVALGHNRLSIIDLSSGGHKRHLVRREMRIYAFLFDLKEQPFHSMRQLAGQLIRWFRFGNQSLH